VATTVPSGLNATPEAFVDWRGRRVEIFPVERFQIGVLNHPPLVNLDPSGLKVGGPE
jgi:hypothetical protein